MTWDDIESILFEGTKEEIQSIRCPDCSCSIEYEFDNEFNTFIIKCKNCGVFSKSIKLFNVPNCVRFFGNKHLIQIGVL